MKNNNLGCLAGLLRLFGYKPAPTISVQDLDVTPYKLRDDFLSDAEASFYRLIKQMFGETFTICPKVSLGDIVYISTRNDHFQAYRNKIDRKHIDFLICDAKTIKPRFAIELDDASHQRDARLQRDEFVDRVFQAMELPLVRVPVQNAYNTQELGDCFKAALASRTATQSKSSSQHGYSLASPPFCPQCGERMVVREARRGAKIGTKFFGCPNYPKSKTVIPINA
jgi:ssDNA-binding Zn-finger/Zn-ribbon topoisomerase 1